MFFQAGGLAVCLWARDKLAADLGLADRAADGFSGQALGHNVRSPADVDEILAAAKDAGARITRTAAETFYGGYAGAFCDLTATRGRSPPIPGSRWPKTTRSPCLTSPSADHHQSERGLIGDRPDARRRELA